MNDVYNTIVLKNISHLYRETTVRSNQVSKLYSNLIHTIWDNIFKGSVGHRVLSSLHEGSLEITLTVPLISNS